MQFSVAGSKQSSLFGVSSAWQTSTKVGGTSPPDILIKTSGSKKHLKMSSLLGYILRIPVTGARKMAEMCWEATGCWLVGRQAGRWRQGNCKSISPYFWCIYSGDGMHAVTDETMLQRGCRHGNWMLFTTQSIDTWNILTPSLVAVSWILIWDTICSTRQELFLLYFNCFLSLLYIISKYQCHLWPE